MLLDYMQPLVAYNLDFEPTSQCFLQFINVKAWIYETSFFTSINVCLHVCSLTWVERDIVHDAVINFSQVTDQNCKKFFLHPHMNRPFRQEGKSKRVHTNFCFLFLIKSLSLQLYLMYKVAFFKLRNTIAFLNTVSGQ